MADADLMSEPKPPLPLAATVAICTYNGAARIGMVLEALARQTQRAGTWEVLVIDNASKDGTGEIAAQIIQEKLGAGGRVVREERPGLSFARTCAAREARGELICFLDDDNVAAPDFVAAAVQAFAQRSKAAVIGGKVIARWETTPTPLAEVVAPFALALCDLGNSPLLIDGAGAGIVGAGLCVRTEVLRTIYGREGTAAQVSGRKGNNLISGEDLVISVFARQMGWECWYVPTLRLEHVLPAGRMDKKYLVRLYHGIGRGQAAARKLYDWKARTPLSWVIGLRDLSRQMIGSRRGPSPALRRDYPAIAADLHELNQELTLGRARQALSWPR